MKVNKDLLKNRSEFSKNTLKLISGTVIAQALSILVSPLLTRLYTPVEFGLFTLVTSIFSILALISGGRFEIAILLPKKKTDAINLLALSVLVNLFFLGVFYVVLFLLDTTLGLNKMGFWYYLLPIFVFIVGISQTLTAWFNRRKQYRAMVNFRVSQSFFNNGLAVANGFLKTTLNGLLLAYLISGIISFGVLIAQLKEDRQLLKKFVSVNRMRLMARKYVRFPLYNTFQSVLDASQINGLIYLISILFGQFFVGIFAMAIRIMFVPMNLIGGSISQVFYQEASELEMKNQALVPLMKKTAMRSALLISPVLVIIVFFGPQLFGFVFGDVWADSGRFAQYLCPWICLDFVRAPLSQVPLIIDKQKEMLSFTIVSNLLILTLFVLGGMYLHDLKLILLLVSAVQVVYMLILLSWIFKKAKIHDAAKLVKA